MTAAPGVWRPTELALARAHAHAAALAPLEMCGVILEGQFRPLSNRAARKDAFVVDMPGLARIARQGPLEAVVHSHTTAPPLASDGDRIMCDATGVPWLIVAWPARTHAIYWPRNGTPPLRGRPPGSSLKFLAEALQAYAAIELPTPPHPFSLVAAQAWLAKAGFCLVEEPGWRQCDVGLAADHAALFLSGGRSGDLLRLAPGQISERVRLTGELDAAMRVRLRHVDFWR